jgi:predicted enzyme related to lactoylglutathione lyase
MPATDLEGVGRMAKLADPYGARFAVIKSAPRQG